MTKNLDIMYHTGQTEIHITNGDLTQVKADVLVSSDDVYLSRGAGISRALSNKAGIALDNDIRKLKIPLELGSVAVTNAGRLPAQYLFHATTMDFATEPPMRDLVAHLTRRIMDIGDTLDVDHIAMPLLGTGSAGFSPAQGLACIFQTVAYHAASKKYSGVKKISIIVFGSPKIQTVVKEINKKIAAAEAIRDRIERYQHIVKETQDDNKLIVKETQDNNELIVKETQDNNELIDILNTRISMARKTLRDKFFFKGIESSDDFGKKETLLTYEGYLEAKRRLTKTREDLTTQIASNERLIEAHRKRLNPLELRKAQEGISVAPEVIIEIEDIKEQIAMLDYEREQIKDQQTVYEQELNSLQHQ